MIHPLFAGFDEGHNMQRVADALGFESRFELLDTRFMTGEEQRAYGRDGMGSAETWAPEVPDGFELAGKWAHEDGPVAMFVRPMTPMAKALWAISLVFEETAAKDRPRDSGECWSANDEEYRYSSLEELLEDNDALLPGDVVYVGTKNTPDPAGFVDADTVIDDMGERAWDIAGEFSEGFPDVSSVAKSGLDAFLDAWARSNCEVDFFVAENVREHTITLEDLEGVKA